MSEIKSAVLRFGGVTVTINTDGSVLVEGAKKVEVHLNHQNRDLSM